MNAASAVTLLALLVAGCNTSAGTATPADAAAPADRVDAATILGEPAPGMPGGACVDGGTCAANTQCTGARCAFCGGLGEVPCAGACRVGSPRYGVCFDDTLASGTLGALCHLEDCTPGTCSVPDGRDFVCFACGAAVGQPCCPSAGCTGVLHCTDDVCH